MKTPIKHSLQTEIVPVLFIGISFILSLFFYNLFPEQVAIHWDIYGNVDGYASKFWSTFLFPILMIFLYGFFLVLPSFDPYKDNYKKFSTTYHQLKAAIIGIILAVFLTVNIYNLGYPIPVGKFILALIGILFIFIGKSFKYIKRNWFFGIRTPWTLSSDVVWNKTHIFGGYVFIVLGILLLLLSCLEFFYAILFLIPLILITVGSTIIYSFIIYRKK